MYDFFLFFGSYGCNIFITLCSSPLLQALFSSLHSKVIWEDECVAYPHGGRGQAKKHIAVMWGCISSPSLARIQGEGGRLSFNWKTTRISKCVVCSVTYSAVRCVSFYFLHLLSIFVCFATGYSVLRRRQRRPRLPLRHLAFNRAEIGYLWPCHTPAPSLPPPPS